GAVVRLADLVGPTGEKQNPLGRRRLPGIDVSHDAEVTVVLDGVLPGHAIASVSLPLRFSCLDDNHACFVGVSVAHKATAPPTSDNARTPGWRPPSCACLHASSLPPHGSMRHRAIRPKVAPPWCSRCA